jgi:citrate lyase subunit beta/citryl-CoA lyase
MTKSIERARSFLFVPASRPERYLKALESGADCVILDLEDAVPADHKAQAREQLTQALPSLTGAQLARTLVRVNAAATPWHGQDLRVLAHWVA